MNARSKIKWKPEIIDDWCRNNLGEPDIGGNKAEYKYNEFLETDSKRKLYVNIEKGVYNGFKSKSSGPFEKLVAEYKGISIEEAIDYLLKKYIRKIGSIEELEHIQEATKQNKRAYAIEKTKERAWSILPPKSTKIRLDDRYATPYISYLRNRGMRNSFITKCYYSYEMQYNKDEENGKKGINMRNFVIIPYYDEFNKIVYWIARGINKYAFPRYYNYQDRKASEYVYNINTEKEEVVLAEGIFKAEKFGEYGIATGGKSVSKNQINQIVNKEFKRIIIMPDKEKFNKGPKAFIEVFNTLKEREQNVYIFDWHEYSKAYKIDRKIKDIDDVKKGKLFNIKSIEKYLLDSAYQAEIKYRLL